MISKYFFTKSYINENSNLTLVTRDAQNNRYISTKMCFTIMYPDQVVHSKIKFSWNLRNGKVALLLMENGGIN
jgi:hypothetical protein